MHWLEGMLRVNLCSMGCPFSCFEIIGSVLKESPWLP
jgi:hypothetical protein